MVIRGSLRVGMDVVARASLHALAGYAAARGEGKRGSAAQRADQASVPQPRGAVDVVVAR